MSTENAKTPPAAKAEENAELLKLKARVKDLLETNESLVQEVKDLKAKQKAAATSAPSGDYCVIRGKTYQVLGTVTTRFASEEGRKNNTEDEELVIIKH